MTTTMNPLPARGTCCEWSWFDGACKSDLPAIHRWEGKDLCGFHSPFDSDHEVDIECEDCGGILLKTCICEA